MQKFVNEKKIDIRRGSGPGFAEVFFKGEERSPDPNKNIIQVRNPGNFKEQSIIAADLLHFLGGKENGKPLNNEFFKLKQDFIKNFSPSEINFARKRFQDFKRKGKTGSNFNNFNNFLQNVWSDLMIRGSLFPELMVDSEERAAFENRTMFTKKQIDIINKMDNFIRK